MIHHIKYVEEIQCNFQNLILETLKLLKNKVHLSSVSIIKTVGININSRNFKLENVEFNDDNMIIITGYHNFKKAIVHSTNLSIKNIQNMILFLSHILQYTSSDIYATLPKPELLSFKKIHIDLFYPYKFTIEKIMEEANIVESYALQDSNNVISTENINISSHSNYYAFGNSYGMLGSYQTTINKMYSFLIAKTHSNIMQQDFSYTVARKKSDLYSPKDVGRESSKKVQERLLAKKISTINCPIIISASISDEFFSHFIAAIYGTNVYKKSTILLHSLHKKIFPKWLNIIEEPHIHKGILSKPFDLEGVQTKSRFIVQNGVLCTWLLDSYSGNKLGFSSTGHCGGIHNWCISNSTNIHFKDLLKNMGTGLLVTEFMGQGVNIVTGSYSRGIFGFWVQNGEIQHPVHEVTIAGNLKDMWRSIIYISNDIEYRTGINCGSILLDHMQISGI
ncbi:metalloprotease PmbA [Buchnera aphidicola]|uniref:metalloprotease PmbA n=1 Tax=Buchnera aphidicola TaxID=9 RepID=UPI0034642D88